MSIEKFNGKQNALEWMKTFELECTRNEITEDRVKIKCLKIFVADRANDWFQATKIKTPMDNWSPWKESFTKVFAEKGWSKIRYAHNFKYLNGSLIEYALKKLRLVLETDADLPENSRMNLIVLGLPIFIQDRLDREELPDTDTLINKLGQFESSVKYSPPIVGSERRTREQSQFEKRTNSNMTPGTTPNRKACSVCELLGFPARFHPIEKCRNRDRNSSRMRVNVCDSEAPDCTAENSITGDDSKN